MSSSGSVKVVVVALVSNLAVALSKLVAALISNSASMFAEAIHSFVDCANQALLLVGAKKSKKKPSALHPLGYGRESFFWSFMVAILLFSMGGVFAIYEGFHKLAHPEEMGSPWLGLGILLLGVGFEVVSFRACLKEIRHQNRHSSLWQWFKKTTSVELIVIFVEDLAALLGLLIAMVCLFLSWFLSDLFWDSLGSILVGSILVLVSVVLAAEIKSLIIGEAPAQDYQEILDQLLVESLPGSKVLRVLALQTGSHEVMLACKISQGQTESVSEFIRLTNEFEKKVKRRFPEVQWSFVEVDDHA